MAALCNDTARCEVLNLGWASQGQGPYLVRQIGYVPGNTDLQPQPFILQRDGRWLLNLIFATLPEPEQELQLFHDLGELSQFLDSLAGTPVRAEASLPEGQSPQELLLAFEQCTHRILRGLRECRVMVRPE